MATTTEIAAYAARIYPKILADLGIPATPDPRGSAETFQFFFNILDTGGKSALLEFTLAPQAVTALSQEQIVRATTVRDARVGYVNHALYRWLQDNRRVAGEPLA